jgi:hypothetical protein
VTRALDHAEGEGVEQLVDRCVPLAVRLVSAVHARRTDAIADLLAAVPPGAGAVLAVVLAAMVDHQGRPADQLAWTETIERRARAVRAGWHGWEKGYSRHRRDGTPPCVDCLAAHSINRRSPARRAEITRIRNAGVSAPIAVELSRSRHVLASPPRRSE